MNLAAEYIWTNFILHTVSRQCASVALCYQQCVCPFDSPSLQDTIKTQSDNIYLTICNRRSRLNEFGEFRYAMVHSNVTFVCKIAGYPEDSKLQHSAAHALNTAAYNKGILRRGGLTPRIIIICCTWKLHAPVALTQRRFSLFPLDKRIDLPRFGLEVKKTRQSLLLVKPNSDIPKA